jgi:hypothetical protein
MPVGAQPPEGHPFDSPHAQHKAVQDQLGGTISPSPDVAFAPPVDLMRGDDPRREAGLIFREIPLITIQNSWSVNQVRSALGSLQVGVFETPGYLIDSILGDDRVQATIGSRVGGLLGAPVKFEAAPGDKGGRVRDAWQAVWPRVGAEAPWQTFLSYAHLAGFQNGQLLWDTTDPKLWVPELMPTHMSFSYYHFPLRHYVFVSLDGQVAIEPGDGKWVGHYPYGSYRGWMRGAVRAIAQPWLMRHFALRDWARFNERHGLPILKGKVPAAAAAPERAKFESQIACLGTNTAMILPQGVDPQYSYDLELLEAMGGEWESFKAEIDQCDMQIVLTLLYQNLTTEVQEGSFAAARVHAAVRQAALKADSRALALTIYHQIARPFAAFNFGDPDLAPWTEWDVTPAEDYNSMADVVVKWTNALEVLRRAGYKVLTKEGLAEFAQRFGFQLPEMEIVDPAQPGTAGGGAGGANAVPKGAKPSKPAESARKPAGDGD